MKIKLHKRIASMASATILSISMLSCPVSSSAATHEEVVDSNEASGVVCGNLYNGMNVDYQNYSTYGTTVKSNL